MFHPSRKNDMSWAIPRWPNCPRFPRLYHHLIFQQGLQRTSGTNLRHSIPPSRVTKCRGLHADAHRRKEAARHISREYSTLDWIMQGLLEHAGFNVLKKKSGRACFVQYLCEKLIA